MNEPAGIVMMTAKEGREGDLLDLLTRMAAAAASDDGTEIYAVHQNRQDPRRFFLYELYRDRDAFKVHIASAALKELGAGLGDLTDSVDILTGNLVAGDRARRDG